MRLSIGLNRMHRRRKRRTGFEGGTLNIKIQRQDVPIICRCFIIGLDEYCDVYGILKLRIQTECRKKVKIEVFGEARFLAGNFVEDTESAVIVPAGTGNAAFCEKSCDDTVPVDACIVRYGFEAAKLTTENGCLAVMAEIGILIEVIHNRFKLTVDGVMLKLILFLIGGILGQRRHLVFVIWEGNVVHAADVRP